MEVWNQGTAAAVPDAVHTAGPTFLWKNTPSLIVQDAFDGINAAIRDSEAMVQNTEALFANLIDEARSAAQEVVYRAKNWFNR